MVYYAIDTFNFLAVPFLTLFVGGYYWTGFSTPVEEYRGRLRRDHARRHAATAARGSR